MTGYIASTRASYYLTTLLLQVVLTEWSYIVPQVLSSMDMELVPLDTTGIEVYKNMFKHGDIPITFGVASPWSKLCFVVLDALIILCDHIFQTLQLMDVELVPWETAKIGIYKGMLKYTDIQKRFETASLWNWTCCVILVRTHW